LRRQRGGHAVVVRPPARLCGAQQPHAVGKHDLRRLDALVEGAELVLPSGVYGDLDVGVCDLGTHPADLGGDPPVDRVHANLATLLVGPGVREVAAGRAIGGGDLLFELPGGGPGLAHADRVTRVAEGGRLHLDLVTVRTTVHRNDLHCHGD